MTDGITGKLKEKLIATKEKWARDGKIPGKVKRGDGVRLPPGQHLVTNWPVLDLGIQPYVPEKDWKLAIDGLVENPASLDWEQFMALPQSSFVTDIHCVTTWSRYDNRWDGVSALHVLDLVKPAANATHIIQHCHDGYTTNVPLEVFAQPDVILAHSWEGDWLTREHGAPMRLVIPAKYFWKSSKWLKRLEFVDADKPGFWEDRGYHNEGNPWKEERFD
jgi:DMSO/TMAO reductase YedYZ molybdopterin-dependent catalytic subunit